MNSAGTALEYGAESNIEYTAGNNISISNTNVISNAITNNSQISNGRNYVKYSSLNTALPLAYNAGQLSFRISGITDLGNVGQHLRVDSVQAGMEWANLPSPITYTAPLELTNNDVKINLQSILAENTLLLNSFITNYESQYGH